MISVCLATFNGERYIEQQLDSIAVQLSDSDEIVISDDGSTDSTLDIISNYDDPRIRLLRNESNEVPEAEFLSPRWKALRISRNFEYALQHATGDTIYISDQDDIWTANKVAVSQELLQKVDLVCSDCSVIDQDGRTVVDSLQSLTKYRKGFFPALIRNPFVGCCMSFKHSVLQRALPFPPLVPMYDIWLGLVAESQFTTLVHPQPLVKHRRHGDNASCMTETSPYTLRQKLFYRFYLTTQIAYRLLEQRHESDT